MSFGGQLEAFARTTEERVVAVKKEVAAELSRRVIEDTPVGNVDLWDISEAEKARIKASGYKGGRLRGNWNASVNQVDRSTTTSIDPLGRKTTAKARVAFNAAGLEDTLYLSNHLPYAYRVEFEGHSKKQRPQGMMRVNVSEHRAVVRKALRKAKV